MVREDRKETEGASAKKELRSLLRERLKAAFPPERSRLDARLLDGIGAHLEQAAPQALAAYCAFREEPVLTPLMQQWLARGRHLYLPRFHAESQSYRMVTVRSLEKECVTGKYGILEPAPELPEEERLFDGTLWLIPGIAFDDRGNRLGRGCGYYDRLLERHPGGYRMGVCWECQMVPQIPAMEWDIRMDAVATEGGVHIT